jgi:hypothetical protein
VLAGFVASLLLQYRIDNRRKFRDEYNIKAELDGISTSLVAGGRPEPIDIVYGADYVREGRLFGEHSTEVIFWYKGFEKYNRDFEELKKLDGRLGIQMMQQSKAGEIGGMLHSSWMKKIPDADSDLSTTKFIRYLLGRDAKEEPTKKPRWQFWKLPRQRR